MLSIRATGSSQDSIVTHMAMMESTAAITTYSGISLEIRSLVSLIKTEKPARKQFLLHRDRTLVPLVLGLPIYTKVTSAIFDYLPVIKFIQFRLTGDVFGFLFPFGIIFGVALGVIGSVSSIRKHLRV